MLNTFDLSDLICFATVALKIAGKKGYLETLDKGNRMRNYFALCGNLLYSFQKESDSSSLNGLYFLESSTLKLNVHGSSESQEHILTITLLGGKTVIFTSSIRQEMQSWMESIECAKFLFMSRKLEDNESSSIQLAHRVGQQDIALHSLEMLLQESKNSLANLLQANEDLKDQLNAANSQIADLKIASKESQAERLMLLKSRGVIPKVLPLWALGETPRAEGVAEAIDKVKIWTGTWNLGTNEPFLGMERARAQRLLQPFVPTGYDIYVLGVQDCCSESVFECLGALLEAEGCRRLKVDLDSAMTTEGSKLHHSSQSSNGSSSTSAGISVDASKLYGRNDGSLLSTKFTGIAVYIRSSFLGDVTVLATTNYAFTPSQSRGAVAVALSVLGRNVVFVNCHSDAKLAEKRREQFQQLVVALGNQLGEKGFLINEQFHHIFWLGDLNYRLVDTSGNPMPIDSAVKMLEDKRLCRTLYETHDQLLQDKRAHLIFYGFREPVPFPNFYPTYKKIEGRNPVDYSDPSWVRSTYRIQHKQPFYKGGQVKDSVPGFCDRILYYSVPDLAEDLLPECLPTDMLVAAACSPSSQHAPDQRSNPITLNVTVDNYRSVNDGEAMTVSNHSPVFATFILRVRHDFEQLLKDAEDKKLYEAGMQTVFSALGLSDKNPPAGVGNNTRAIVESAAPAGAEGSLRGDTDAQMQFGETRPIAPFKYSLLAAGAWYRVRVTNLKLLWGTNDELPRYVSVMFPSPYEALAGEKFADFHSEGVNTTGVTSPDTSSTRSPSKSVQGESPPAWGKVGPSRTGSSLIVDISTLSVASADKKRPNNKNTVSGGSMKRGSIAQAGLPPLVLTWRGNEPLDRLHISLKAATPASVIGSGESDDMIFGHCSIGLEQLCKVAVASTGGVSGSLNVARILVNSGRPMYNIDTKTMQREMVTLCCTAELLPSS